MHKNHALSQINKINQTSYGEFFFAIEIDSSINGVTFFEHFLKTFWNIRNFYAELWHFKVDSYHRRYLFVRFSRPEIQTKKSETQLLLILIKYSSLAKRIICIKFLKNINNNNSIVLDYQYTGQTLHWIV